MSILDNLLKNKYKQTQDFIDYTFEKRLKDKDSFLYFNIPERAFDLLKNSINKKIILITDYDCDGICSAVIGHKFFSLFNGVSIVNSNRKYDRGMNSHIIYQIEGISKKQEPNLIITADMGTMDGEFYNLLHKRFKNLDIIVTDHHTVLMPNEKEYKKENIIYFSDVLINCMLPWYKDKCICGATTLYIFLRQYLLKYNIELVDEFDKLVLPYTALSILIDNMPLNNLDNRVLVKKGIEYSNTYRDDNFKKFAQIFKIKDFNSDDFKMKLGPYFNTGNRYTLVDVLTKGLIKNDHQFLDTIQQANIKRKREVNNLEVNDLKGKYFKSTIIDTVNFIGGIIANKLLDEFNQPCIVFNKKDNTLIGSVRSNINILPILRDLPKDIVIKAAGHNKACGLSIYSNKYEEFIKTLDNVLKDIKIEVTEEQPILINEINNELFEDIKRLEPYGEQWEQPIFKSKFTINDILELNYNTKFYKLGLLINNKNIQAVCFNEFNNKTNDELELKYSLDTKNNNLIIK